jgi:hypothetical protein
MKHLPFITGFTLAACLFLFIGATRQTPTDNTPRYHMSWYSTGTSTHGYVYDAVTGKCKSVTFVQAAKSGNIKELLEQ